MTCCGDLAAHRWGVTGRPSTRSAYRTQPGEESPRGQLQPRQESTQTAHLSCPPQLRQRVGSPQGSRVLGNWEHPVGLNPRAWTGEGQGGGSRSPQECEGDTLRSSSEQLPDQVCEIRHARRGVLAAEASGHAQVGEAQHVLQLLEMTQRLPAG